MAKKELRAYYDAKKDSADEYPRIAPLNRTTKRKYKGYSVDWFIARSLRELDKYDRELRVGPAKSSKPSVHDPLNPLYEQIGLKLDITGKVLEEVTFDQVLPDYERRRVSAFRRELLLRRGTRVGRDAEYSHEP